MFDEDHSSMQAEMDVDYRPLWKQTKAKHDNTLKAKKITFSQSLGPQLDKLSAAEAALHAKGKTKLKSLKLTVDEQNETNPAKRKAIRARIIANDKSNQSVYKGLLKAMFDSCKSVRTIAESYKLKLKGLGDPAEKDLVGVLNKIIAETEKQEKDTQALQTKFKDNISKPGRFDSLK